MSFATAVNCVDGRVQEPVREHLVERFGVAYVDMITEAGPVALLADEQQSPLTRSIFERVAISVDKHQSSGIAVIAHHDCAGNPVDEATQRSQLGRAVRFVASRYPKLPVVGLWVNADWQAEEVQSTP